MTKVARSSSVYRGQAIYGRAFLPAYDATVYRVNSPLLWRCGIERLVAHYDANLGARHLDVGVASGRVLDEASFRWRRRS